MERNPAGFRFVLAWTDRTGDTRCSYGLPLFVMKSRVSITVYGDVMLLCRRVALPESMYACLGVVSAREKDCEGG